MAIQYRPDSAASPSHVSYEIRERHTAVSYERELIRRRRTERNVVVEGIEIELQAITAIPLGFVANELITNAAKYSTGRITVSLEFNREKGYAVGLQRRLGHAGRIPSSRPQRTGNEDYSVARGPDRR